MENIIKESRLALGVTQREVARLANMSPQAVMRYEQGLYENLSTKLCSAVADMANLSEAEVEVYYASFRAETQRAAIRFLRNPPPLQINETHPFRLFREGLTSGAVGNKSRMAFCILLAVHPATVAQYDEGKVKHMPSLIRRALEVGELDATYLKSLMEFGEIWYERHTS